MLSFADENNRPPGRTLIAQGIMYNSLNFIDLFAGGGGLSEGFIQEGFEPVAHVESDVAACNTLRTRMAYHSLIRTGRKGVYADYLTGEISREQLHDAVPRTVIDSVINEEISPDSLKRIYKRIDSLLKGREVDVLVGGPPCQAYSIVGRARDPERMVEDERNHLYKCYAKFLTKYRPKRFVFENVAGILSAKNREGQGYFDSIRNLFHRIGYESGYAQLRSSDFGVLQNRKRVVLIGWRKGTGASYPEPEKWDPNTTVSEVFGDLPSIGAGEGSVLPCNMQPEESLWRQEAGITGDFPVTWHVARPHTENDLEIYRIAVSQWNENRSRLHYSTLPSRLKAHRNKNSFVDRFKVVAANLSTSQTVVAHICKDGHYYIHPDLEQNRSITPREAARLQTFPDNYYFEGANCKPARTQAFRQIGNAVPVLLARKIAAGLKRGWDA